MNGVTGAISTAVPAVHFQSDLQTQGIPSVPDILGGDERGDWRYCRCGCCRPLPKRLRQAASCVAAS